MMTMMMMEGEDSAASLINRSKQRPHPGCG